MDRFKRMKLSIYENYDYGLISESEKDYLLEHLDYVMEGFPNPFKNRITGQIRALIGEIKNERPDKYSPDSKIKSFILKNSNKLIEVSNLIENEPTQQDAITKRYLIRFIIELIAILAAGGIGYILFESAVISELVLNILLLIPSILAFLDLCFWSSTLTVRNWNIRFVVNDLTKIQKSLDEILHSRKLPIDLEKNISRVNNAIHTSIYEWNEKLKNDPDINFHLVYNV